MKILFVCVAVLALLGGAVAPFASGHTNSAVTDENNSTEDEIRRLNSEEVQAFVHNDPKEMARLWSDDFVVTNPLNKFVTKKQVLGMVTSGFLVITSYDRQIEYVRFYGDTVIVAGNETVVWGGKMPNAGKTEHLRFTGIWMKQRGRWQQVARHANIVPEK
jgi:uncharacterized protein (TIGR02246 family)